MIQKSILFIITTVVCDFYFFETVIKINKQTGIHSVIFEEDGSPTS